MPLLLFNNYNSVLLLLMWALVNGTAGLEDLKPKAEPLFAQTNNLNVRSPIGGQPADLPLFPERNDAVYFVVAVSGGAKSWGRTLARTLLDMGAPFSNPQGPPLRPIYVDLPLNGRFSSKVLTALCEQIDGVAIAGMIVVGDGQSARSIALAGNSMKIPVLWAKGGQANLHGGLSETQNVLQATLQPSAKEILEAIRAIFLQTHWHSFFVLSDVRSTMVLGSNVGSILKKSPLAPTILPLSSNDVFRQLAKISRSTRGIVLLLCDLNDARRVMSEAQRLHMVGGHFIWIWADTSSTAEFFQPHSFSNVEEKDQILNVKENYESHLEEFIERKSKYDKLDQLTDDQLYNSNNNRRQQQQQNNTRWKNSNSNSNRFHHIIGLTKPGDPNEPIDAVEDILIAAGEKSFLKSDKLRDANKDLTIPIKAKRSTVNQNLSNNHKATGVNQNDYSGSNEHPKIPNTNGNNNMLHIKNINSDEYNSGNYYDPSLPDYNVNNENENNWNIDRNPNTNSDNDNDEYYDNENFDKMNPYQMPPPTQSPASPNSVTSTTRRPSGTMGRSNIDVGVGGGVKTKSIEKPSIANKNLNHPNRNNNNRNNSNKSANKDQQHSLLPPDHDEDMDENYSTGSTTNDLKAKRANSPSNQFNISSHVFFHNYKDFPVGLLALRPIKMNVDRIFIRSVIRLFASTWSRVDRDEELRPVSTGPKTTNRKNQQQQNWNDNDYDYEEMNQNNYFNNNNNNNNNDNNNNNNNNNNKANKQRNKNNYQGAVNGNNRHNSNNARVGGRKYKRALNDYPTTTTNSHLVNSTLSSYNSSTLNTTKTYSNTNLNNNLNAEHVSGLNITDDDVNKSNNINNTRYKVNRNSYINQKTNGEVEKVLELNVNGNIDNQKRQNTWWSNSFRGRNTNNYNNNNNNNNNNNMDLNKSPSKSKTPQYRGGCFGTPSRSDLKKSETFARYLRDAVVLSLSGKNLPGGMVEKPLISNFEILNLVPSSNNKMEEQQHKETQQMRKQQKNERNEGTKWRRVGLVLGRKVHIDTIVWPGGDIVVSGLSARARSVFRVVTSLSPPFVMESNLDEDGLCLRGLPCHRLSTSGKHNLTLMFNSIETKERLEEDAVEHGNQIPLNEDRKSNEKVSYKTRCCYGLSMDLLQNMASELGFEYHLYIVSDELFGSKQVLRKNVQQQQQQQQQNQQQQQQQQFEQFYPEFVRPDQSYEATREQDRIDKIEKENRPTNRKIYDQQHSWNGIVGDLVAGSADMSFAPLSVSKARAEVIDFSAPYFHSGVSLLAAPKTKTDIPLLAFLMPFSPELWIAIFIWLNVTAVAVAVYEWLSPFGLNPWGRQRSKNFSLSSALWVMWGLLCGHLVAFKAPKSWPNKFLINVWGGFSVIFIASYTANIAALIAGLFFHNAANTYEASLLKQRVGIPRSSAAESYIQRYDKHLWEHTKKYTLGSIEEGIQALKNRSLDLLLADSPILDYYRGSDHGCSLRRIGENYVEDTYAIGMSKGFPLKDSISALIAKYSSNGYLDILVDKWYGALPCFKSENDIEIVQPRPLGVAAVAGVFLLLAMGMVLGVLILIFEHMFFKYYLPHLRHMPKDSVWRSRNIMFFSQKLYRFINCVDLVSPHHAARELVHTLRKGHITSLFQKSVKRKEDEQRRRRKSKAQFFEMIQEIRRVQQNERDQPVVPKLSVVQEVETNNLEIQSVTSSVPSTKPKVSPKLKIFTMKKNGHSRSNSNASSLNVRRFSTDSILGDRLEIIGRRLSRDIASDLANSPPDLGHRFETFGKNAGSKFDTFTAVTKSADNLDKLAANEKSKFDTFSGTIDEIKPELPVKKNSKNKQKRKPLNLDVYENNSDRITFENQSTLPMREPMREPIKESFRESLHPAIFQLDSSKAVLRDQLHEELRAKYGQNIKLLNPKPPKVPSTANRLPFKNGQSETYLKVQSTDSLNVRPIPQPRTKKCDFSEDDDDEGMDPTYATITPRNKSPRPSASNIPLGRLSKEDLLKLSQSTESEIHEFLNGNKKSDPP